MNIVPNFPETIRVQLVQVAYACMIGDPGPLIVRLSERGKFKFTGILVLDQSTLDLQADR
jgi:hypothetical protein